MMKGRGDGDTLWFDEWEGEAQLWMMGLAYVLHGQPSRPGLCQIQVELGLIQVGLMCIWSIWHHWILMGLN